MRLWRLATVVADAQQRLPKEQDRPNKDEIQQEIGELEYRLTQLQKSIGAAKGRSWQCTDLLGGVCSPEAARWTAGWELLA
jgi:hypothetical protein